MVSKIIINPVEFRTRYYLRVDDDVISVKYIVREEDKGKTRTDSEAIWEITFCQDMDDADVLIFALKHGITLINPISYVS